MSHGLGYESGNLTHSEWSTYSRITSVQGQRGPFMHHHTHTHTHTHTHARTHLILFLIPHYRSNFTRNPIWI